MTQHFMPPIHPGTVLQTEFLEPMGIKPYSLSKLLGVPRSNIEHVVRGKRPVSAALALRLAKFFGNSAQFWVNLQSAYDLECAKAAVGDDLDKIQPAAV